MHVYLKAPCHIGVMYPNRQKRSRLRSLLSRVPFFMMGMMLAGAVLLFGSDPAGAAGAAAVTAAGQVASFMGFASFATIFMGAVMQLMRRTSHRAAGFAGMGVGVGMFMLTAMFAGSI